MFFTYIFVRLVKKIYPMDNYPPNVELINRRKSKKNCKKRSKKHTKSKLMVD